MAKSRAAAESTAEEKSVSQVEMVRLTLEELGGKAKPQAIQEHIKTKFNKDLPTTIISNYKSVLKKKGGAPSSPRGRKPGGGGGGAGGLQVEDLATVRGLVTKLGADQLKKLVDVLG